MDVRKGPQALRRRSTIYNGPDSPHVKRRLSTITERKTTDNGKSIREAEGPRDNAPKNTEAELEYLRQPASRKTLIQNSQDYLAALVLWNSETSKLTKPQLDLFLQSYSSDDSLQDYTETLHNAIGKREDNTKILWFAKKVRPVYDFVKNFTPVASAASEFSPVPFSAVLGGIACILSISVKVDDYQAKMVETLDRMMFQLDLLKDYKREPLFEHDTKVEASQINVTTDILKFCVAAAKALFNEKGKPHNALLHLLKLQLKDFNSTFGSIEAQFSRHLEELGDRRKFHDSLQLRHVYRVVEKIERDNEGDRTERKTAEIGELEARERKSAGEKRRMRADVKNISGHLRLMFMIEERHQCVLDWLQFVPFTTIQDTTYCNRVDETGDWLMDNLDFQNWRQGVEPARLWIHGKAGSGKSFLAARIINDLKKYVASETAEISAIAYAYCSSTKLSVELTYSGLLSSLLRQLYNQLALDQDIRSIESRARSSGEGATRSELKEWIHAVIARLRSCFIIIDGLDECQFLGENEFEDLCRFIASLASPKDHTLGVKVVVFSRPNYSAISNALLDFTEIPVDKGANDADMKLFITTKIDKIHLKQPQDHRRDEIKETIREQADGMFLWVDLRVKDLQHLYSVKRIQKALETASKGLDGLYRDSMKKIPEAAREHAFKALLWLANSHKSLSKAELLEALAVEDGETELTDEERLPPNMPLCTMCADLLVEEGDYYQLIHASLKDFLLKQSSGIAEYDNLQQNAHLILAQTCLTYLTFDHLRSISCSTSDEVLQVLGDYPLLGYAAQYWGDHFSAANGSGHYLDQLSRILLEAQPAIGLSIKIFGFEDLYGGFVEASRESTALHLLSIFNLPSLAEYFPRLKESVNDPDCFGHLPIDYAMIHGSKEMVNWILEVYKEDQGNFSSCLSSCLVHLLAHAAEKNWEDVVKILITLGFEKDLHTEWHPGTALYAATVSRAHDAMRTLLDLGAEPNVWTDSATCPLMSAVIAGDLHAIEMLLAANANPNIRDGSGLTPLHHAARGDTQVNYGIAGALLNSGAEIEAEAIGDYEGWTPLGNAAWLNLIQVAEVLLREGADIEHGVSDKYSPLSLAVRHGNLDLAAMLIQYGASTTPSLEEGLNLLHCAVLSGSEKMVEMVLSRCGDLSVVDGRDAFGSTPFSTSIGVRLMPISLMLLNNGAVESLKEWVQELPEGFFPELYQRYLLHDPSDPRNSSTLKTTLISLAMPKLDNQIEPTNGDFENTSQVHHVETDVEQTVATYPTQSPGFAQSNIAQNILTELNDMHNDLLRLHLDDNEVRLLRRKAGILMDACYFSHNILDAENAGIFIDQTAYDEIMRIEIEIANLVADRNTSDEVGDPEQEFPNNDSGTAESAGLGGKDGVEDDGGADDSSQQVELLSEFEQLGAAEDNATPRGSPEANFRKGLQIINSEYERSLAPKKPDMWTEITRDLVVKGAIEEMGYAFQETQSFFYVEQYLTYDEVLELVMISDEMKKSGNVKYWFNPRGSSLERHYLASPKRRNDIRPEIRFPIR